MKKLIISFIALYLLSVSTFAQPGFDIANAVVKSYIANDFQVLQPYLLNENNVNKAFPDDFKGLSKKEVKEKIDLAYKNLSEKWETIKEYISEKGVDLGKVEIIDIVIYPAFAGSELLALTARYTYESNFYEDLTIIVSKVDEELFLLDFPSSTRTLVLHNVAESQFDKDNGNNPNASSDYENKLRERVEVLLSIIPTDDNTLFGNFCVYRGEDLSRKWKDRIDPYNQDEMQYALSWKMRLNKALTNCPEFIYEKYLSERESEGVWIVQPLICDNGDKIYFAFLEIKGELLLGDIDIEKP